MTSKGALTKVEAAFGEIIVLTDADCRVESMVSTWHIV